MCMANLSWICCASLADDTAGVPGSTDHEQQIQDEFSDAGQSSRGLFAEPPRQLTHRSRSHVHSTSGSFMISARGSLASVAGEILTDSASILLALYLEIIFARELRQGLTDFDASELTHPELELELVSSSPRSDERDCADCVSTSSPTRQSS